MSSKRKWDQASPEDELFSAKVQRAEDGKTASEAAAAAAAIAAKIAAQFAGGTTNGTVLGPRDPHDSVFTHDIDINDVRNRYVLTKGSTQEQINLETGANVTTKGVWYPDRSKASEKDPPLYLHISANTQKQIDDAVDKIKELMDMDMGPLVEDKKDMRRERVSIKTHQVILILAFSNESYRGDGQKRNCKSAWNPCVTSTFALKLWDRRECSSSISKHRLVLVCK